MPTAEIREIIFAPAAAVFELIHVADSAVAEATTAAAVTLAGKSSKQK